MKRPAFDMRMCDLSDVAALVERYHGYGAMGIACVYAFAVYEDDRVIAAYAWQPPPPGAAKAVCPEAPGGVLALSRMVAVPRTERCLQHISKPLRRQMHREIDRGRWPVLITFSDEGQGHTGHVYKCSGWRRTRRSRRPVYENASGQRASAYSNGKYGDRTLIKRGYTYVQRWEHWACPSGSAAQHMAAAGWQRVELHGRRWRSGNQAYKYVRVASSNSIIGKDT